MKFEISKTIITFKPSVILKYRNRITFHEHSAKFLLNYIFDKLHANEPFKSSPLNHFKFSFLKRFKFSPLNRFKFTPLNHFKFSPLNRCKFSPLNCFKFSPLNHFKFSPFNSSLQIQPFIFIPLNLAL